MWLVIGSAKNAISFPLYGFAICLRLGIPIGNIHGVILR